MQKKLIALAITAAFSAPAFADTSVYGKLDVGYGDVTKEVSATGATTVKTGQSAIGYGQSTSSRFGIKNTQDLDNGIKAIVTVETSLSGSGTTSSAGYGSSKDVNTTAIVVAVPTSLGNRELNLGLDFGQGTVAQVGWATTPIYDLVYEYDAALSGNLVGNLVTNDGTIGTNRASSLDVSHQFGPLKALVGVLHQTNTKTGQTDSEVGNGLQTSFQYKQDALSAAFAYQSTKTATNAVAAVPSVAPAPPAPIVVGSAAVAATEVTTKIALLVGSYDLGVAKLFGEFANVKTDNALNALGVGAGKRSFGSLGVQVPVMDKLMGFAVLSSGSRSEVTTANVASVSRNLKGFVLGAKYDMGTKTYAYASVGQSKMDAGVATSDFGTKINQYALGVTRVF